MDNNKNPNATTKLTSARRVLLMILVIGAFLVQVSDRAAIVQPISFDGSKFAPGINYPWNHYGRDFGANAWGHSGVSLPAEASRIHADFETMSNHGVRMTRWFVFGDARSGILVAKDGTPTGLDEHVFNDLDAAVSIARQHKVYVIFVLFDFLLVEKASVKDGVTMGGRRDWILDQRKRKALIENVIAPILRRYGKEPIVAAWEVMNEPEWAMRLRLKNQPHQVRVSEMQNFVKEIVASIHANSDRPATLGSASPRYMSYWRNVGLDLYQYHYYPRLEGRLYPSKAYSHSGLNLDKPLILGEFPTDAPLTQPADYFDNALSNGCSGALGWSLRATDQYSNAQKGLAPIEAWSRRHSGKSGQSSRTDSSAKPMDDSGSAQRTPNTPDAPNAPKPADLNGARKGIVVETARDIQQ